MRKLLLTLAVLCGTVSAWADFTQHYSSNAEHWTEVGNATLATELQTIVTEHNCTGTLHYGYNEVIVSAEGDITVTVDYTGGSHKIVILGVELLDANNKVVKSDYHFGESGGNDANNVYTLSSVPAGEYLAKYYVCSKSGDHALTSTSGQVIFAGNITEKTYAPEPISTDFYYQIKNVAYDRILAANENYAIVTATVNASDLNQLWAFEEGDNGTYYLRNAGQEKYLGYNGTNNQCWPMSETPTAFTLGIQKAPTTQYSTTYYSIKETTGDEYSCAHDANWGYENGQQVVRWLASASASQWIITKTEIPSTASEVNFTYSFTYNGEAKYTQECTSFVGEEYPDFTVTLPYGISATKPSGELTAEVNGTTITIELTENLPFVPATSNSTINNWYYIQMHSSGGSYSRYLQNMDTYIEWLDVEMTASDDRDSYTWAFVGNPFDGFKLVNKAAGTDKAVCSTGSGNPTIGEYTNAVAWEIKNSRTNNDSEHFCFKFPDGQYMNAQNGKVAFWSDNDQGSTMWVTERDLTGATELQALIDKVNGYSFIAGTSVGYCTQASIETLNNAIKAAKTALQGTMTAEISAQHTININNALTAIETIQPEEGKFYIIKSAMPSTDGRSGKKIYVNNDGDMKFEDACTMAHVFQFVNAGANTFYLKCVERGTYLSTNKAHGYGQHQALATTTENAKALAIANMGRENVVSLIPTGGAMIHAQAANSFVVAWDNTENTSASAWIIEELDINTVSHSVTIDEFGWATLVLGYNATIPEGVTAYVASSVESNYVNLTEVSSVIPANTAVLLNAAGGTYSFNYSAENGSVGNNELFGYTITTEVTEDVNSYALTDNGENAVFGKFTGTTNKAFKAYLNIPVTSEEAAARFLVFNITDGTETGIENIEGTGKTANAAIYDLSGRRMHNAQKGIFIVNGKKVVK